MKPRNPDAYSCSISHFNVSNIFFQLSFVILVSIPDCENIISQPFDLSVISIETRLIPEKCHGTSSVKTN